jgi:hypothetical protein
MVPTSFDESNRVLSRPPSMSEDECEPLSVFINPNPALVISCWKLTKEELEEINRTGRVWLWIYGPTMQPALLTVKSPFVPAGGG